jgi:hypothetical protein
MKMDTTKPVKNPIRWICRASRINPKTGLKEYARDYGLRGFPIPIYE